MGCHHVYGAIGIESGVEAHTRSHTDVLYLSFLINRRLHSMPSQLSHRAVGLRIYPALVDGMGKAISVDGRGGSLEIGIIAVEQLMPKAIMMLQGCQTTHM